MKYFFSGIMLLLGLSAGAMSNRSMFIPLESLQTMIVDQVSPQGLSWKVGEMAQYSLDMGFLKGKMVMTVREEVNNTFWLDQDVELSLMGKQKIEVLVDKNTGKILEVRVNGQKQQPPEPGQTEVEETHQDRITVPKGTFDCIYARIKDVSKNEITEVWINPSVVPISGALKQIAPSPMGGKLTMELTDFIKK